MSELWDKEAVYDAEISPLVKQIIALCKEHRIPLVATFQIGNDEERGGFFSTTRLPFTPESSQRLHDLAAAAEPGKRVLFAETEFTDARGTQMISIRRMA